MPKPLILRLSSLKISVDILNNYTKSLFNQ
jgi:hypothetical protein